VLGAHLAEIVVQLAVSVSSFILIPSNTRRLALQSDIPSRIQLRHAATGDAHKMILNSTAAAVEGGQSVAVIMRLGWWLNMEKKQASTAPIGVDDG
jgi:hypothetical protein